MDSSYLRKDLLQYKAASNLSMNDQIKKRLDNGEKIYHLGFGQSPFPVPKALREALIKHAGKNAYLSITGIAELRSAICSFHKNFSTGIPASMLEPDNIIVSDGSKMLIFLMMTVFEGALLMKSPTWTTYKPQSVLAGGKEKIILITSHEKQWKITPAILEQAVSNHTGPKMMIFTNPCNPTGAQYSESELEDLSVCLRKHRILVVSDEIYAHLAFNEKATSLSKFYPEGTIITSGLSKWASAGGWRIGYAIFPPELKPLKQAVASGASHTYSCCAAPQQYAAREFLSNTEACFEFMSHTQRILKSVSTMCVRKLTRIGIQVQPSQAGYYIFPDFCILKEKLNSRGIYTGQQFCDALLEEAKVALLPGGPVHLRPDEEFTVRLCYINFDGKNALEESIRLTLKVDIPESFVFDYCTPTVEAIEAIVEWCNELN